MTQERPAHGYVVDAREGLAGHGPGVVATRESTQAQIDGGPPLHVHDHEDESFYVLEGAVTVRCGGDVFEAVPRSFVFLPRLVPHAFRSAGGPVTLHLIAVPGGIEDYFRDLHQAAGDREVRRSRRNMASRPCDRRAGRASADLVGPYPRVGGKTRWAAGTSRPPRMPR